VVFEQVPARRSASSVRYRCAVAHRYLTDYADYLLVKYRYQYDDATDDVKVEACEITYPRPAHPSILGDSKLIPGFRPPNSTVPTVNLRLFRRKKYDIGGN
jgi:hypothetical protein